MANNYDDTNRAFLQALLSRGTLTFLTAQPILAAILSAHEGVEIPYETITVSDLDNYVSAASAAISPFDYEIRSAQHQVTKERWYAIVNGASDAMTQLATTRTPDELAFVKRVLDFMFETNNTQRKEVMGLSSMEAIKLAKPTIQDRRRSALSADNGLTSSQAEELMQSLTEGGWLERSARGLYTLSPRALMELKGWLVATYNDPDAEGEWQHIKNCVACKNVVTVGQRCTDVMCNVRLHEICARPFWRQRRNEVACPSCGKKWDGAYLGEKALEPRRETGTSQVNGTDRGENDLDGHEDGVGSQDELAEDDE